MDYASDTPCFMKFKIADDLFRWNMTYSRRIMLKVKLVEQYVDTCDGGQQAAQGDSGDASARLLEG